MWPLGSGSTPLDEDSSEGPLEQNIESVGENQNQYRARSCHNPKGHHLSFIGNTTYCQRTCCTGKCTRDKLYENLPIGFNEGHPGYQANGSAAYPSSASRSFAITVKSSRVVVSPLISP